MKRNLFTLVLIFVFSTGCCQERTAKEIILGYSFKEYPQYSFQKYPAVIQYSKAKLNLSSHPLGKEYPNEISKQYNSKNINFGFGGHYIVATWGAGIGLTIGAMVDTKTGTIYELPMNEENSYRDCSSDNLLIKTEHCYSPYSNLFITYRCFEKINKTYISYTFYKWDGKRFNLIGKLDNIEQ